MQKENRKPVDLPEGWYWCRHDDQWQPKYFYGGEDNPSEGYWCEIGPKITPPTPKHVCKWILIKGRNGKHFRVCECGAMLIPEGSLTEEDRLKILEDMKTPGSVFEIVGET